MKIFIYVLHTDNSCLSDFRSKISTADQSARLFENENVTVDDDVHIDKSMCVHENPINSSLIFRNPRSKLSFGL
jgi:hypothetical protein